MPTTSTNAKRQARAKVGAKTKIRDNKLYRIWANDPGVDPEDRDYLHNFYFRRRHLATGISDNGDFRMLKYQIEADEMDEATCDGLKQIYQRDGAEIFEEVSLDLLKRMLGSIEYVGGGLPKRWRRILKELVAEQRERERIEQRSPAAH
jgi:hypothetical protein